MIKLLSKLLLILISTASHAQQWSVRGSVNAIKSACAVNVTSINDPNGDVQITNDQISPIILFNRIYNGPKLGSFIDISVIRHFNNKQALMVSSSLMSYPIYSSVTNLYSTYGQSTGIALPAIKINYRHTVWQNKKNNPAGVILSAGILLNFKNWTGSSGMVGGSAVTALDSSGNLYWQYKTIKYVGAQEPRPPFPYMNIGIEGYIPLGKRFKLGIDFTFYAGTKSLFIQHVEGKTNDATFTYDIKLKQHFYSGGLFLQYRIK